MSFQDLERSISDMAESKGALKSLTVQGAIVAVLPSLISALESLGIVSPGILNGASEQLMQAIGAFAVAFGLRRADKPLKGIM